MEIDLSPLEAIIVGNGGTYVGRYRSNFATAQVNKISTREIRDFIHFGFSNFRHNNFRNRKIYRISKIELCRFWNTFGRWIGLLRRQGFTGFKFCWWSEISNFAIFENVGMWIWGIWVAMQCWASSVRWTYSSQLALVKISYTWAVLKKGAISKSWFWSTFWNFENFSVK